MGSVYYLHYINRYVYGCVVNSINIKSDISDKKGITQDIYVMIFLVFISRKLQLSSIEYYSCDQSPNQLQSRGVSFRQFVRQIRVTFLFMVMTVTN